MIRYAILALATVIVLGLSASASAQSSAGTSDAVAEPNRGGTPGSWVQRAISRHNRITDLRVNSARGGSEAGLRVDQVTGTSGGLGGLFDLAGLGALGDLAGLAGATGSTGTTSGGTSGFNIGAPSSGTDYTLADLIRLGQQYDATQKPLNSQVVAGETVKDTRAQSNDGGRVGGGAIARLPKPEERYQQVVDEPKFVTRWANAMLQSVFSALTFGLQSRDFIEAIKDSLRPLISPPAPQNTDTGSGDTGSDTGSGSDTSGSDSGSTDGIENLGPPADDTGDDGGGSTI